MATKMCPLTDGRHPCDMEMFLDLLPNPAQCFVYDGKRQCAPRCNGMVQRWYGMMLRNAHVAPPARVDVPVALVRASMRAQFGKA